MRVSIILLAIVAGVYAAILSLDLGSDSIKIGLIGSGNLDVVLDKDSSRKLQSTVGFKNTERLFGKQALQNSNRNPESSFSNLKLLLGKSEHSDSFSRWNSIWSAAKWSPTDRGTLALHTPTDSFTVEELLAMQFQYAKQLAENEAGEAIKDVVLALPPYYSSYERQAILDAVNLSSLQPIALINDGTAVAVNYAMTRAFDATPSSYIIYDAGASSLSTTLLEISSVAPPKKRFGNNQNTTVINVIGTAYDSGVGGIDLDHRLREILANAFEKQHKLDKSWRENKRAWNKLLVEAGRVKHILSANTEAQSTIEGLHDELDFKTKVSRDEFKAAISEYEHRWSAPIGEVLKKTGRDINSVNSVILTGGASRIPVIQSHVRSDVGDEKISTSVNADESAVLGAAFYGATFSKSFRTKPFVVNDASDFSMEALENGSTTPLWIEGDSLPVNKTLVLPPKDTEVIVQYTANSVPADQKAPYMQLTLKGVEEALQDINLSYDEAIASQVRAELTVEQTAFSLVFPVGADLVVPAPASSEGLTGKLKEWFSGNANATTEQASPPEEKRIKLDISSLPVSLHPMTVDAKGASIEKLTKLNYAEKLKALREESFNGLESRLYVLKDVLANDEEKFGAFHNVTQAHELEELKKAHSEALEWVDSEGWSATLEQIQEVASKISSLETPIKERLKKQQVKAAALGDLQKALFAGRTFLQQARKNLTTTDESRYTFKEIDDFEAHLFKTENWLRPLMRKDEAAKPWEEGAYNASELEKAGRSVQDIFMELTNRKPAKKTSTESASSTPTSSATEKSTTSESATSSSTEEEKTSTKEAEKGEETHDKHRHEEL
ncbi:actin-like ATPase domain-containing protein [Wallemia mellicola]|nr:actin-like ATPase domain-containing protein [Wallemia mellicola]